MVYGGTKMRPGSLSSMLHLSAKSWSSPSWFHSVWRALSRVSTLYKTRNSTNRLPGVMGNHTIYSWYRTTFDVPSSWTAGNRVLLNFGAVDWNATVFVNGHQVFNHVGGYFSFSVDVTDQLSTNGTNELYEFPWVLG